MNVLRRPCLCLVTSRRALSPDARTVADEISALERFLDEALAAGVDLIQVRERDLEAAALRNLVAGVVRRASTTDARIVVNDRLDVARAARAHGVHLRADGPPTGAVRRLCPPPLMVGRSVHSPEEAASHGTAADYLLCGTVFRSASKAADAPVVGPATLGRVAAATSTPVLAIGGITPERVRACLEAGAAGVAAIGVFLPEGRTAGALGVGRGTRELRAALERI